MHFRSKLNAFCRAIPVDIFDIVPLIVAILILALSTHAFAQARLEPIDEPQTCTEIMSRDYPALLAKQKAGWEKLAKPMTFQTEAGTFTADFFIAHTSSYVFFGSENKVILKFYNQAKKSDSVLALYEQLVSEFLLNREVKVPKVITAKTIELPDIRLKDYDVKRGAYSLVVKEYFEGLTSDTLEQTIEGFETSELHSSAACKAQDISQNYFGTTRNGFFKWAKLNHADTLGVIKSVYKDLAQTGDANIENLLCLRDGTWVMFDP